MELKGLSYFQYLGFIWINSLEFLFKYWSLHGIWWNLDVVFLSGVIVWNIFNFCFDVLDIRICILIKTSVHYLYFNYFSYMIVHKHELNYSVIIDIRACTLCARWILWGGEPILEWPIGFHQLQLDSLSNHI